MSRFLFDGHRLEAVFAVLGFDRDEALLQGKQMQPVPSPATCGFLNGPSQSQYVCMGSLSYPTPDAAGLSAFIVSA